MKRALTDQEKRTIRIGTVLVAVYLALFFGKPIWKHFATRAEAYQTQVAQAKSMRQVVQAYEDKALVVKKLMEEFHMDPATLKRATLVAETSAAIQKAAGAGGLQTGPIRESSGRSSAKEAATIQFEGSGPVPAVLALLHNLQTLGFPVVIDTLQLTADPKNPMALKVSMTILVLDFEAWKKKEEAPNA
jgi:hypothetical protein